jgi:hypothetical protein
MIDGSVSLGFLSVLSFFYHLRLLFVHGQTEKGKQQILLHMSFVTLFFPFVMKTPSLCQVMFMMMMIEQQTKILLFSQFTVGTYIERDCIDLFCLKLKLKIKKHPPT